MNQEDFYASPMSAAQAEPASRAEFIRKTYAHLAGAILAFGLIESLLIRIPFMHQLAATMAGSQISWLITIGLMMGVSMLADRLARSESSPQMNYLGLGLYVLAQAVIFLPLILVAQQITLDNTIIYKAIGTTFAIFGGLSLVVLTTRKDFSFLGGFLKFAFFGSLAAIVVLPFLGIKLGVGFSLIMILVAGALVLYQTSGVMRDYRTDQHVAASLGLFSSFTLLLWYVMQLFMNRD